MLRSKPRQPLQNPCPYGGRPGSPSAPPCRCWPAHTGHAPLPRSPVEPSALHGLRLGPGAHYVGTQLVLGPVNGQGLREPTQTGCQVRVLRGGVQRREPVGSVSSTAATGG